VQSCRTKWAADTECRQPVTAPSRMPHSPRARGEGSYKKRRPRPPPPPAVTWPLRPGTRFGNGETWLTAFVTPWAIPPIPPVTRSSSSPDSARSRFRESSRSCSVSQRGDHPLMRERRGDIRSRSCHPRILFLKRRLKLTVRGQGAGPAAEMEEVLIFILIRY
jgi:hypothetical protein